MGNRKVQKNLLCDVRDRCLVERNALLANEVAQVASIHPLHDQVIRVVVHVRAEYLDNVAVFAQVLQRHLSDRVVHLRLRLRLYNLKRNCSFCEFV